jgi:hypothetical protein
MAWGQSPVETTAGLPEDASSTAPAPIPGPETNDAPARPDPKVIADVAPATPDTEPKLRPGARDNDLLSRHWLLGASVSYSTPFGNFTSHSPIGSRLGAAYVVGLDAGYGLTRHLQVSLAGEFVQVTSGSKCSSCDAASYSLGARVRYHLVEGTRFDPWVGYGFGYRQTMFDTNDDSVTFDAIEPIRLELGGDWYASSVFTLGPILAVGVDRTIQSDDNGDGRWSTWLSAGIRVGLDPTGR